MTQIECKGISLAYEGQPICRDLSFSVEEGDYLCIVGDNGSGKSTLLRALLSLKSVAKGEISFCNGITKKEIGYLPQQSEAQKDFPALVEDKYLSCGAERACEQNSLLLTARERAVALFCKLINAHSLHILYYTHLKYNPL